MTPENLGGIYRLSPVQEGILFHSLQEPENSLYVSQLLCTLTGSLERESLRRAWQLVLERHAALRTGFHWEEVAHPVQVTSLRVPLPWEELDWRGMPAAEQERALGRLSRADRERGFDLTTPPLLRLTLVRMDEEVWRLVCSFHHLVLDGWSLPLVFREVFTAYAAFCAGRAAELGGVWPYRDFINWLHRRDAATLEPFWRQSLDGFSAATPLATERSRNGSGRRTYERRELHLKQETTSTLAGLARRQGLTLNNLLQGAWALLLARYSREEDVVFGITVSGRSAPVPGIESMVGLFINTLPLRVRVDPGARLSSWLRGIQETHGELLQHEHAPLVDVQSWSDVPRGLPLFESILSYQNFPLERVIDPEMVRALPVRVQVDHGVEPVNYPLALVVLEGERLELQLSYEVERFGTPLARRMLDHLRAVLEWMAGHPDTLLSDLKLLSETERHQLLWEWSGAAAAESRELVDRGAGVVPGGEVSIAALFEAQVDLDPLAVAVVFGGESLTYGELDERSNRVARHLAMLGVGPEVLVGLCVERSLEMVVGLLGILKAGGAYVPLDPQYPAERLAVLIEDTLLPVVVGQERWLSELPVSAWTQLVALDTPGPWIAGQNAARLGIEVSAESLAYVMYTSGSTGRPKGVSAVHRGVTRLVRDTDYARFGPDEVFLQLAPLSFDASTLEIWGPLLNGGRLVVAPPGAPSLAELGGWIAEQGVTTLWLTAGLFHEMVEREVGGLRPLRQLLAGGDVLQPAAVRRALREVPGLRLINGYGPTENTTFTACHAMSAQEEVGASVWIGLPIAGTTVYVVDGEGHPAPVGVWGELLAGGPGLGRGYAGRPDLTAERWVPDGLSGKPGLRLYRTGDLVRWRAEGVLEFLGRVDRQVKVRGYRIEPGEVEVALLEDGRVREAVVVVREEEGDKRLVAYGVAEPGQSLTLAEMREWLGSRLPEPMIPTALVMLPALPLTANGKVDRAALPAPELAGREAETAWMAPRTPAEEILAGIWSAVLGVGQVGAMDNFFDLGGHSLLATRVISQLRSTFQVELGLHELFEAPTVTELAARIEEALRGGAGVQAPPVEPVGRTVDLPLSFAQQRLWFIDQMEPGTTLYNVPIALRARGEMELPVLERTLGEVIRRHEVLRTVFAEEDGLARQVILPPGDFSIPCCDFSQLPETERGGALAAALEMEAQQPFDLARGPLFRAVLWRLGEREHVLLLAMHHIVSDGWSLGVLVREVTALYTSFLEDRPSPLPELPVQYADFAVWQRGWLTGETLERELSWWRERLAGAPPVLDLPTDRPRPAVRSPRGSSCTLALSAELTAELAAFSRRHVVTLFMTLLSAFQVLLSRSCGQSEVVVGTPIAGRNRLETEGLIGFFVNTLVLRAEIGNAASFAGLVSQVRQETLDAYAHQDLPFEKLVEELAPERSLVHTPLFQVGFALQNAPLGEISLPRLWLTPLSLPETVAKFDVDMTFAETPEGIAGALTFASDLFDRATMVRFLGHLENLLRGVLEAAERPLTELQLLTAAERHQLLLEWRGSSTGGEERCVHELFHEGATRRPDAVAATSAGELLTYGELDRRSSRLARYLNGLGVGPEVVVGLFVDRSPVMLVGLLAILKAGGLYVPFDPSYPRERLAFMAADCGASVMLTQEHLVARLPDIAAQLVRLDADWPEIALGSAAPLPRIAGPGNAAYAIYTSGSTGTPKGAVITHRSLLSFALGFVARLGLTAADRMLQFAALSFDVTVEEIFPVLLAGGRVVLRAPAELATTHGLTRALDEEGVTLVELPTALWHDWVFELQRSGDRLPASLRRVLTGTEQLLLDRVVAWRNLNVDLVHVFGLTEVTVTSLLHVVKPEDDFAPIAASGLVPVGRPFGDNQVHVLDSAMQEVPVGVTGELYFGGAVLARGYLGRMDLTAERFVPDPFGAAGERLYRTGDLGRWLADGTLVFLGRRDRQVKIRGFRIELGEIEVALAALAGVREAVAVVQRYAGDDRRLVAYVVGESAPGPRELGTLLASSLPAYMVPSHFVSLSALPLTANGKLDRAALPAPERVGLEAGDVWQAPRTPVEEILAGIWTEVLGLDRVGPADNFFDLGGHSLLAMQVVSRLRSLFQVELGLRELFEEPTLAGLAARVEEALRTRSGVEVPPIEPVDRARELPLSFAQQRLWFIDQLEPGSPLYNVPIAIGVNGELSVPVLERTLGEVVRRHEVLRTVFSAAGGPARQVILPVAGFAIPWIDLSALPPAEREAAAASALREEARRPFDLGRGPLFRAVLWRLGERENLALLAMHHIVSDGWSMGNLVREVAALYPAFREGLPSPLPELPVQYADYAVWQRDWLRGEVLGEQLGYWRELLAGAPVLELPADRPRPAVQRFAGADEPLELSAALSERLSGLCRREGVTPYMALLAGLMALLHRVSGQDDVVVGSTVAGRSHRDLEPLIGFFVNTLPLRSRLPGGASFRNLLRRVREGVLGVFAHQDVPFEKLVAELEPERDLSRSPLFQALFQYVELPEPLEIPGLVLTPAAVVGETAKFDLVLNLGATPSGVAGGWKYRTDLFDRSTLARLSEHLRVLLSAAVTHPDGLAAELPLLSREEERQLVAAWNPAGGPAERFCLHERFAARAAGAPQHPALSCAGETLTYRELDRRANGIARWLVREGVRPGDLVGLFLERSLDLVAAILGVLKAGAGYLPLDPTYPAERLAFTLADCGVSLVLSQESLIASLPAGTPRAVRLDAEEGLAGAASEQGPRVSASPDLPAYVIYTSGSTGRPKGVVVSHGNVASLLAATESWFGFGPEDVWTLFHSYAFDFSVWEIWGALLYGGRLVVVPYWVSRFPDEFYALLCTEAVTVLNQTPSAFRQLMWAEESAASDGKLALRYVIFGGEALEPASLRPWVERHGDERPRLINMYGITETTVHVTYREIGRAEVEAGRGSVIGRPIPHLTAHLLDASGLPVPIGVAGEIQVGGAGVAAGYLGRPELTAERFVPDPFSGEAGARLYRSGDLARRLPDGELEYWGRIDHQVKIRGFRIELGEIEAALVGVAGVREAVVMAREQQLVAYVVAEPPPTLTDLRAELGRRLPDYMLPSALVVLDALPLTASGKVDRRALPAPGTARPAVGGSYRQPAPGVESFLAGLFQEVLPVDKVGADDDFFALGGDSIIGAVLINRLQQELGEIVHVVVIFDTPTVARLAAYLQAEHGPALRRRLGLETPEVTPEVAPSGRIDASDLAAMRSLIEPSSAAAAKNRPAVFVLSAPRSGSTLLRVMLGGHPDLFAPPELELLSFTGMAERRSTFSGRDAFWREGLIRAVLELRGVAPDAAREEVEGWERDGLSTQEVYRRLQESLGSRLLVDKTPSYALDLTILRRAEEGFTGAKYLHLVRHPCGMIRSFEEAKLDLIFFRREHRFTRRQLAELIWLLSEQNIREFLDGIPAERRHVVRFEDLVAAPEPVLRGVCGFLGIDYHPAMAAPYQGERSRMTDGLHAESRMLGDVKFHEHAGVDAQVAARWRDELSEELLGDLTRALAAELGYGPGTAERSVHPVRLERAAREGDLPLSFAQQRLWFIDRMEPGTSLYNLPIALRIRGELAVGVLERTLGEVVRRHEVLRTVFVEQDGRARQVILPPGDFSIPLLDLAPLPESERDGALAAALEAEAHLPFDLSRGPLFRAVLWRLDGREHVLLVAMHHIVSDGWSLGVLVREVGALYASFLEDRPSPLPELPVQYADFAVWQRSWLSGEVLEHELEYWRERLAGIPPFLDLPTDRPRPAVRSQRGAVHRFSLSAPLCLALAALCRGEGATLFMMLLAAFAALLSRLTGQDDLTIGTPVAGRNRPEIEGLIGFFVNTLIFRPDLSGEPGFAELLRRVRREALQAQAHQDLPFERLVEELSRDRSLDRTPLFQVMLALQNAQVGALSLPGLELSPRDLIEDVAKFDLLLVFSEGQGEESGIGGALSYATDLFDAATMASFAERLDRLLAAAVASPGLPVAALPLLSVAESQQLVEWSGCAVRGVEVSIGTLFESQVDRDPQAVAVVFCGESLTYGELDARSNRLARHLARLGVGPEVLVGLCVERSLEMVVGLLGILKAGGAYVPLDPQYPADRLAVLIEDTLLRVVVGQERWLTQLPVSARTQLVALDTPGPWIAGQSAARLGLEVGAESLAYVMYTSGSTGRPKGVAAVQRGVTRLVRETDYARFGCDEVFLQLAPLSFDASTLEIWGPLLNGGRLVVAPPGAPSLEDLGRWIAEEGVTTLWLTAGLFHEMVEREVGSLRPLRQLLAGGDVLQPAAVRRALREVPGLRLINGYGPTENTTFTACHAMSAQEEVGASVWIGLPIAGTTVYVVDGEGHPAPVGVWGELLAGGSGLGRGYAGRPDLTAERWVPDGLSGKPGLRLYRTGDLVRWRAEGVLEFLGRVDRQVKVRGYRIEPGEVEAALLEDGRVSEAVVVVREEGGDKRLVAYGVAEPGQSLTLAEMREWLGSRLPEPMIPTALVMLPALPLTANGKVDRAALPAPELAGREAEAGWVAPRTPVEEILAGIWSDVLGLERVGAAENFFDLGGHSLLATRVISQLRGAFQVELGLHELFEAPTVAELAARIEEALRDGAGVQAPPIEPVDRSGDLPLSFAQQRLWFIDRMEPGTSLYNVPIALRALGDLAPPVLERTLGEVVRRHEVLRTVFADDGGRARQVILPPAGFSIPVYDLSSLPEAERETALAAALEAEAHLPFDLSRGPLFRAVLWRLDEREHVLLVAMHHIVSDGWSLGVLVREVGALYASFLEDGPSPLPELPVQYADFAVWQRSWLSGEVLEHELEYWRERLSGIPLVLDLPTDRPRPAVRSQRGAVHRFSLSAPLSRSLAALCRREGATRFMLLLAAFAALLSRLTGQDDLTIGTPIAGRNRSEIEGLIGFFVNTLIFRPDLSGEPGFAELLRRVRREALQAQAHQDLPFERLVEELSRDRSLDRTPLFQVMLALQNAQVGALSLPGLELSPRDLIEDVAKFDLLLVFSEGQGEESGIGGALSYATDLFDAATMASFAERLERLLAAAVASPGLPVAALPLLSVAESQQLVEWSGCAVRGVEVSIGTLFESQVDRDPQAVAVVFRGESLTYGELDARSNRLARHLARLGVGPEVLVGLCVERSLEMVVGLLGILKAGGAYVPLDPQYPADRLAVLIEDTMLRVVVGQERWLTQLPVGARTQLVALDTPGPWIAGQSAARLGIEVGAESLVYVMYTSGSTGRPKGVAAVQRGVTRLVRDTDYARFGPDEVFLQLAPLSFDASTLEIWGPLLNGGRLVVAPPGAPSLEDLGRWIAEEGVTTLWLTAGLFHEMVEREVGSLRPLRQLLAGGDVLQPAAVRRALREVPGLRLINGYGPTENTTFTACHAMSAQEEVGTSVWIGLPIAGTTVHVVDGEGHPAPVGVWGELLAGGSGLGRGYAGRPDLTAERWVPDGLSGKPGLRLYRTGDLVRWRAEGVLEFLGRVDRQVKVRGYRIEPGEVEAALLEDGRVSEAVVVVREEGGTSGWWPTWWPRRAGV